MERQKKREKQRGSAYVKAAQRRSQSHRKQPAHVHEADGVRECVREKEGRENKVGEALLLSLSQKERERRRVGEKFIIHVCEIRIKLNRLLGIILRDFPT